jgi:uric acid transporter
MSSENVAFRISADLFACGRATLAQRSGLLYGIPLPTVASVGPRLSVAAAPERGLLGIGSVIGAGLFAVLAASFMSRLSPLFPLVTGIIILMQLLDAHRQLGGWRPPDPHQGGGRSAGRPCRIRPMANCRPWHWAVHPCRDPRPDPLGQPIHCQTSPCCSASSPGAALASLVGVMQYDRVACATRADIVMPLHFGIPQFHLVPILTMWIAMAVVIIESVGMFLALADIQSEDRSNCACPPSTRRKKRVFAAGRDPALCCNAKRDGIATAGGAVSGQACQTGITLESFEVLPGCRNIRPGAYLILLAPCPR